MSALTFSADPVQTARLAAMLRENARLHLRFDAAFAATMAHFAAALEDCAASPGRRDLPKHRAALRAEREATVRAWMMIRVATWPAGKPPPPGAQDIEAAKDELKGIPERYVRAARWPGWRRPRGRPKVFGKK